MIRAKALPTQVPAMLATPISVPVWQRGKVERFVPLPAGEAHPEGICRYRDDPPELIF